MRNTIKKYITLGGMISSKVFSGNGSSGAVVTGESSIVHDGLLESVLSMSDADRAALYVDMNCFDWPDSLSDFKPSDWDSLAVDDKIINGSAKYLMGLIYQSTSPFGRSQAWWDIKLNRSSADHLLWWKRTPSYLHSIGDEI